MESVFQKQAFPRHVGHDMTLPRSQKGIWGQKGEFGGRKGVFGIYFFSTKVPGRDKAGPACPGESRLTNAT